MRGAETVWLKKRGVELKNAEQSSPKHPLKSLNNTFRISPAFFFYNLKKFTQNYDVHLYLEHL